MRAVDKYSPAETNLGFSEAYSLLDMFNLTMPKGATALFLGFCGLAPALTIHSARQRGIASNTATSLTLMFQNNLNTTDDVNHISFLVLDPVLERDAATACAVFGEILLTEAIVNEYKPDFGNSLAYLEYTQQFGAISGLYQINNAVVVVDSSTNTVTFKRPIVPLFLPVLCTQHNAATNPAPSNEIVISSGTNTFVGLRSQKAFQFLGIPYADQPERFEHSEVYSQEHQTIEATAFGSECAQVADGSEACLFLNIYTPFLPKAGSSKNLRPVLLWIHGGGYTGGAGSQTDGSNLASREDIVFITINYRLSTLGFLAIPDTTITGNYGIGDQITAIEVR